MSHTFKYSKISYENRLRLIQLIQKENKSIKQAAFQTKIKITTARAIYLKFKTTQTVFQKRQDKKRRKIMEQVAQKQMQRRSGNIRVRQQDEVISNQNRIITQQCYPFSGYTYYVYHNFMLWYNQQC